MYWYEFLIKTIENIQFSNHTKEGVKSPKIIKNK